MLNLKRIAQSLLGSLVLTATAIAAAAPAASGPQVSVRPQARISGKIDSSRVQVVANSSPRILALASETGRLASSTRFSHMLLVLKSSDVQEYALRSLLDEQQDKGSPNFHQWMTPETFAQAFGVASVDLAKITAWLQDSGFSVDSIAKGSRVIEFSGTAGQVEAAFHTEMHSYLLNGEAHIANASDIAVPEALAGVVAGVARLSDFLPRANAVHPRKLAAGPDGQLHPVDPATNGPEFTGGTTGPHYVGPGDLAAIYNAKPLLASGIDGTGQKIGVIGQTTISLANYQTYRSIFKLPKNDFIVLNQGPAPAVIGDDIESDLDVDLAGSLASKAGIYFYTASRSLVDAGIDTASLAAVDSNVVDIISLSYGGCELSNGIGPTTFYNTMWQQAAAQGQTVFVSTGDSNATGCASSSAALATGATAGSYAVNALGSGAYNVAVGGSEFFEDLSVTEAAKGGATKYWGANTGIPYATALSYIPEIVWNEGNFDIVQAEKGVAGAGGGVSIFTARPSWQVGPGIGADPAGPTFTAASAIPASQQHRLVPDVAFIAAGDHDGTMFCSEGTCTIDSNGNLINVGIVGGTSVATPAMASVQALINQKNGGRQGNANYYYYKLAAAQTTANCASSLPPAATCNFNDIVTGNNYSPKTNNGFYDFTTSTNRGTFGTDYIGFAAGTGYDVASGLGSPNITNLANNWSTVSFNATKTTLTLSPTTANHGATMNATIAVAAVSGTGTPTGNVSITAVGQTAGAGDGNLYTLSAGTVTAALQSLPGGTYSVVAHYAGDGIYGSSDSAPVTVTIAPEDSNMVFASYNITTAGAVNSAASFAYGTSIYIDAEVTGVSNAGKGYTSNGGTPITGAPTGSLLFEMSSGGTALAPYTSPLDVYGTTYLEVAQTFTNFAVYANYPAISPGAYTLKGTYSGDKSFNTVNKTINFTVVKASVTPTFRSAPTRIASGASASFTVGVTASGGGVAPTGTLTLNDATTSTVLGTGTMVNGVAVITTTGITTAGGHSLNVSYSGDANYNATTSGNLTVTVGGTASTITLAASTAATKVLAPVAFTATVPAGQTGNVYFYDGGTYLGGASIVTATNLATLTLTTLPAGTHSVTASYTGSATYQSSTSNAVTVVVAKNTPTLSLTAQQAGSTGTDEAMNANLTLNPSNLNAAGTASIAANPAPSAPVQFLDGTTVLGTGSLTYTLNYATYSTSFTTQALTPGPHKLTANFPGDTNYAAATSAVQNVNIGLTTTTVAASVTTAGTFVPLTLTANVVAQVASATPVSGTVTFYDGTTAIGTANAVNGVATLAYGGFATVGPHAVTAVYAGNSTFYTSTSATAATVTATLNATLTTLASSVSSIGTNMSFTLTATVVSQTASTAVIGGTVTFYDGAAVLGTSPVTGGKATYTATLTTVATHTITAVYSGDANYATSTTAAGIAVVTGTPAYSIVIAPTTLTIRSGLTGTATITGTSVFNYSGTAELGCNGLPAFTYCGFSPARLTFNGTNNTSVSQLTIYTVNTSRATLLWIPTLLMAGLLAWRRKQFSGRARQLMVLAILFCGVAATSGCGNGGTISPNGTYSLTVYANGTGTTTASPNIQPSTSLSVTIQ